MLLMSCTFLMVGIWFSHFLIGDRRPPRAVWGGRRVLRLLPVAIALALVSIPVGAWATSRDPIAEIQQNQPTGASVGAEAQQAAEPDYASRESRAKGLENFQGGDTIVIGSGVLIVVLLVVLIVVLV